MGLILPQTVKVRTNGSNCKYYREKGYEFEKCGEFIEVDVLDLQKSSNVKVKIKCEIYSEIPVFVVNKICHSKKLFHFKNILFKTARKIKHFIK